MKFTTEKKTLCIYTDPENNYSVQKMECELKSLRRELDGTKEALRLQTVRCRQLVAAFTSKLQEKDAEVRAGRLLKDRQLSQLLRALLALEARLRREQRSIREQLARKDALIRTQHREIARLRHRMRGEKISEERPEDCDSDAGKGKDHDDGSSRDATAPNPSGFVRFRKNQSKTHSHRIFKPAAKQEEVGLGEKNFYGKVIIKTCDKHSSDEIEKYQELERLANTLKEELDGQTEDDIGPDHEEEVTRDLYKDYQHNPVLECVNQILLRDKDDAESLEEENKSHVSVKSHYRDHGTIATMSSKTAEDGRQTKDKTASPPLQAQKLEEKACLMMSTQRLTVVRHPELEELDAKNGTGHHTRTSVPPALPPKPPQLGSKSLYLHQKKWQASHAQSGQHSHPSSEITTDKLKALNDCGQMTGAQQNMFITHCHDPQSFPCSSHVHSEKPRQRQILSNGSLKRALNQENTAQGMVNGFHHNSQDEHDDSSPVRRFKEKLDALNLSNFTKDSSQQVSTPQFISPAPQSPLKQITPEQSICGTIKVGSSVSSLITGSSGGSIVTELTQGKIPHVHSLVRRFEEGAKDTLQGNFEEFRLEDVDMEGKKDGEVDKGRPEADGAETKGGHLHSAAGVNYEHFLEATGLSQKSILTPSRMLSNHRSVIKPKDVKHRSKVLRAQTVVSAAPAGGGPVVKYWMEPFL